jgi:hypothetical protein
MSHTDDCPKGRSQFLRFESTDKIVIDRKTFKRAFLLLQTSVDILANVRHREVFLECLNKYLVDSAELDDSECFRATLLLDAYYDYVPASLALLGHNLQEAFELMRGVQHE